MQAWFEVKIESKVALVGMTIDEKEKPTFNWLLHERHLAKEIENNGRVAVVKFLTISDRLSYEHETFRGAARQVADL